MADGDEGAAAPKKGLPLWLILGGGGALALVLFLRHRGTAAQTQGPLVPAIATDPNTGLPVNPLTGLPYQGSTQAPESLGDWVTKAENWMIANHISPSLAAQALYNYVNGKRLTEAQASALQRAIQAVGFAPVDQYGNQLPWNGPVTVPGTGGGKGPYFNANVWHWAATGIAGWLKTIPFGSGKLTLLGTRGSGLIRMPHTGAPIYALTTVNGKQVWERIDSLAAFLKLPSGTRVATMKGQV